MDISDTTKEIALKILTKELGIDPIKVTRYTNGYCHSVYYVKTNRDEVVLRVTSKENEKFYMGSIKWLNELNEIGIPVPKIIKNGHFREYFYALISFIPGKDLGDVYQNLTDNQKKNITKEISKIQKKVSSLPVMEHYGYPHSGNNEAFIKWMDYLKNLNLRSEKRIKQNGILNTEVCDTVTRIMTKLEGYFETVKPTPFLDDITTKNVLIFNGELSGIVDIDEVCYGDPLSVIGLTNMALLGMEFDTKYIEYWLDEIKANEIQRRAVMFYTLLSCVDFMGEQGMKFNNDKIISYDENKVELLKSIFDDLIQYFQK